jgi:hypothetical protein
MKGAILVTGVRFCFRACSGPAGCRDAEGAVVSRAGISGVPA